MVLQKILRAGEGKIVRRLNKIANHIETLEDDVTDLTDAELRAQTDEFKERLADGESLDDLLPDAFATVREAAIRTLGQRHFKVQLMGGAAMHLGNVAEMRTGEGKTLAGTLPAYLNALTGDGVHVVTTNDYLARRDAEWMGRVHRFLGLSVGVILANERPEHRREQYSLDITYGTNNEFGFDYLRDNMAWSAGGLVQRGHNFAIVDEVDSILIDEARTPLIISGPAEQSAKWYGEFARIVPMLKPDRHYEVEEGKRTVAITEEGVTYVENQLGIDNLYEAVNTPLIGYLNNALKAKELFRKDRDYIVTAGEVLIVDEFTGRVLSGRRYNEGLHQAIEAKEKVTIKDENQTLATITLQNYFRLYDKLSGMTGTAQTEAAELSQIYKLGVVSIPTNKDMIRADEGDLIYKTEEAKFNAVADDIAGCHQHGQPVLVGTTSVEKSELLSKLLLARGVPHEVLNAKHHEREAAIVAQAGHAGAVTVATNMAGRGTDIMLGGNPDFMADQELRAGGLDPVETREEYEAAWDAALAEAREQVAAEAEEVKEVGGLYVLGTERHESRRIDNQLRGRSGRQGDPGESRFYLSAQDDLVRLFAGDRIHGIMNRFKIPDDQPMEASILSRQIESAQKKVEEQNFVSRKNVLKYDDVMNTQRLVIYDQRRRVLEGEDLSDEVREWITETVTSGVAQFTDSEFAEDWDLDGLVTHMQSLSGTDITVEELREEVDVTDRVALTEEFVEDALETYAEREQALGADLAREVERYLILQVVDQRWREHLESMDYLREGVHLRAFAQKDPLVEYRGEGHVLFEELSGTIRQEVVFSLFHVSVQIEQPALEPMQAHDGDLHYEHETTAGADAIAAAGTSAATAVATPPARSTALPVQQQVVNEHKDIGRNDPCWCGSGKKFKKCHGA